jgi:hypothetical protein
MRPIDIYARQSRKGDKQKSTPGQVAACRLVLQERGMPEGKTHVDDGRSAWNPRVRRPGWDELMTRLETREAAGVVVYELSRFSRRPMEGERLIALAESGLAILDSESEYDLTQPNGKKAFRDHLNSAAYYSDDLSRKVRRGKLFKAMNGNPDDEDRHVDRGRVFGWEDDGVTVRESEACWIRFAAEHLLHGDAQDLVCRHLTARGVTTVHGREWTGSRLREMLLRERNRGNVEHRGAVVARLPGEPVLDAETFDRLTAMYTARRPGRPYTRAYLASGVAFCTCGRQLSTRPVNNRSPYPDGEVAREYWCSRYAGGCGLVHIDQRELDAAAAEQAIAILADPRNAAGIEAAIARHQEAAKVLDSLIADAEKTAQTIGDRLGRGEITLARHDAITGPLDARLAKLRVQREELAGPPAPVPARKSRREWLARWEDATPQQRMDLLRGALSGALLQVSQDGTVEMIRPER